MFVATKVQGWNGYEISEVDADGVGRQHVTVTAPSLRSDTVTIDVLTRLCVLALNMDGGPAVALQLLRAEYTRQNA